jgi:hypothetical protein
VQITIQLLLFNFRYTQNAPQLVAPGHYQGQPQYQVHPPQQQFIVDQSGSMVGGMNVSESSAMVCNPAQAAYNNSHILRYTHQATPNRR